jgi:DNA mismatch endonuclease (patch repair protein)
LQAGWLSLRVWEHESIDAAAARVRTVVESRRTGSQARSEP